jgi:hypothetical protein
MILRNAGHMELGLGPSGADTNNRSPITDVVQRDQALRSYHRMTKRIAQHQVSDAYRSRGGCYDRGELDYVVGEGVRIVHSLGTFEDYVIGKKDEIVPLAFRYSREITNACRF